MTQLKYIIALCLMVAGVFTLICAGIFFLHLSSTADQLKQTAKDADTVFLALKDTATESNGAIQDGRQQVADLGRVMGKIWLHLDKVAGEAQREQKQYYAEISQKTSEVLDSASQAIKGLNTTQEKIGNDLHSSTEHLNTALDGIPPLLTQTDKTMASAKLAIDSLNTTVSDPAIKTSLQNISVTTENAAKSSTDIQAAIHRWTKPASVLKSLATNLLGIGVRARAFF
jgi:hypothetical protein